MSTLASAQPARQFQSFNEITAFIWSCAELMRGVYKQSDHGKVVLPVTVLRRLDCVLEPTKPTAQQDFLELQHRDLAKRHGASSTVPTGAAAPWRQVTQRGQSS